MHTNLGLPNRTNSLVSASIICVIFMMIAASLPALVVAEPSLENIDSWVTVTPLPEALDSAASAIVQDWLYVLGGRNTVGNPVRTIRRARVNSDGSVTGWLTVLPERALPKALRDHRAVSANGRIYVVGGYTSTGDQASYERGVYMTTVNGDGSLTGWQTLNPLPTGRERAAHGVVAANGHLYVLGGYRHPDALSGVWRAQILPNGTLGTWQQDRSLPQPIYRFSTSVYNGAIYVIGGQLSPGNVSRKVFRAVIQNNGSLGTWVEVGYNKLGDGRADHFSAIAGDRLFVIGGKNNSAAQRTVLIFQFGNGGSALVQLPSGTPLPNSLTRAAGVKSRNQYAYLAGGLDGAGIEQTQVWRLRLLPTTFTPTPTPTPTARPTNHPPYQPTLLNPPNGSTHSTTPTLCWWNNGDPDGDQVHFWVDVWTSGYSLREHSGWIAQTCWQPPTLSEPDTYFWRVYVRDEHGMSGPMSFTWTFNVNTSFVGFQAEVE